MIPVQSEITVKQIKELIERHVTIEDRCEVCGPKTKLSNTQAAAKEIYIS